MKKTAIHFSTVTKDNTVTKIGRAVVLQPKPQFKGGSVRWFDDSKLLKKNPQNRKG